MASTLRVDGVHPASCPFYFSNTPLHPIFTFQAMSTRAEVGVLLLICTAGMVGITLEEMVKPDLVRYTD